MEPVADLVVDVLGFFGRAFPAFNDGVHFLLKTFVVWENFFTMFDNCWKFFPAKLLEFGELHPESLDEANVVPGIVGVMCAVMLAEGDDLFGVFGSDLMELNFGGKGKPDLRGSDGSLHVTKVSREPK